jgi:hypothetical protein
VEHWADGGATVAENLILLCRFHHSRIHLDRWSVEKTGPGRAVIKHLPSDCTDAEWEADLLDLPNGHNTEEWSPVFKTQLTDYANWYAQKSMEATVARTREQFREADAKALEACHVEEPPLAMVAKPATPTALREDPGDPPFLTCPQRATAEGSAGQRRRSPIPKRDRAPQHVQRTNQPRKAPPRPCPGSRSKSPVRRDLVVAARLNSKRLRPRSRRGTPAR